MKAFLGRRPDRYRPSQGVYPPPVIPVPHSADSDGASAVNTLKHPLRIPGIGTTISAPTDRSESSLSPVSHTPPLTCFQACGIDGTPISSSSMYFSRGRPG